MVGVARKGRNFTNEEELQVCRSQLSISQDPIVGNGQRKESFWDRVGVHYNHHRPRSGAVRTARSIETKWGVIKHDVAKFAGAYGFSFDNKESGTSLDDVLRNALELYKDQNPKSQPFTYLHCWYLLKDHPRWMETPVERTRRAPVGATVIDERRRPFDNRATEVDGDNEGAEVAAEDVEVETPLPPAPIRASASTPAKRARPQGSKNAKEEQQQRLAREQGVRVQQRVTADMAAVNFAKAQVLQDQAALSLFVMPEEKVLNEQAREYIDLRREEELLKLRERMVERRAAVAKNIAMRVRQDAAAARERVDRGEEIIAASERRGQAPPAPTPPPPATPIPPPVPSPSLSRNPPSAPWPDSPPTTTQFPATSDRSPSPPVAAPPVFPTSQSSADVVSETQLDFLNSREARVFLASVAARHYPPSALQPFVP